MQNSQFQKNGNLALKQCVKSRWHWSKFESTLLVFWIFSHTVTVDIVYELKLFDLVSTFAVPIFFSKFAYIIKSKDTTKKFLFAILLCVTFGSLITFIKTVDLEWALVVFLRWWRLFSYLVIFLLIRYGLLLKIQYEKLIFVVLVSCGFQALLIVLQHIGIVPILWPEDEFYYDKIIASGTLGLNHVNNVIYMVVGLGAAVAFISLASPGQWLRSMIAMLLSPIMVAAMFIGEARLAFVALPVFSVFLLKRRIGWKFLVFLACMIVMIGILTRFDIISIASNLWDKQIEMKVGRRAEKGAEGFQAIDPGRNAILLWTIDTILNRPDYLITGIGYQNFKSAGGPVSAHNTYFQPLIELGVIGFVAWMGFFVVIYRSMSELERCSNRYERNIMLAGKAALLAIAVSGFFNDTLYPVRNNNGFLGFALAFFAIASSGVWRQTEVRKVSSMASDHK